MAGTSLNPVSATRIVTLKNPFCAHVYKQSVKTYQIGSTDTESHIGLKRVKIRSF